MNNIPPIKIPCPNCGENVDIPVKVLSVSQAHSETGSSTFAVQFFTPRVAHSCDTGEKSNPEEERKVDHE